MNKIFLGYPPEKIKRFCLKYYTPLCFEAVDSGATIALKCNGNNLKIATFQTSTDGQNWSDYTYGTEITLTIEEDVSNKVYFRAKEDNTTIARETDNYLYFTTSQPSKKVKVSGNVMSLLAPQFSQMRSVNSCCFCNLFYNCRNVSDCGSLILPATTLAYYCYFNMFYNCSSLTQAPSLPATTLAYYCYIGMFRNCSSLRQAPSLPATTLAYCCYYQMFHNCSSLTQAPSLPATTLANDCYYQMFRNCSSLTQAPSLPATTLAHDCYYQMFFYCTKLTQASFPNLVKETVVTNVVKNQSAFYSAASNIETTCKDGVLIINSTSV